MWAVPSSVPSSGLHPPWCPHLQGRGRIEKTEIIEMAIKHLRHLQAHSCKDPSK